MRKPREHKELVNELRSLSTMNGMEICGDAAKLLEIYSSHLKRMHDDLLHSYSDGWISLKEREPKFFMDDIGNLLPFLVTLYDYIYPREAEFDGENWYMNGKKIEKYEIEAWMPCPPRYGRKWE